VAILTVNAQNWGYSTSYVIPVAQGISNVLTAAGWVQTSDTGQTASASMVMEGYQIWRMNDSLQATAPVFMKIIYQGAAANTGIYEYVSAKISITLGTGSNGSGTLLNPGTPVTTVSCWSSYVGYPPATFYPCYLSADSASLRGSLFPGTGYQLYLGVERTKDVNGVDTTDGCTIVSYGGWSPYIVGTASLMQSYLHLFSGTQRVINATWATFVSADKTTLMSGNSVSAAPVHCYNLEGNNSPLGTLVYFQSDLPGFNNMLFAVNGTSRLYKPLNEVGPNSLCIAMRWE
jgi:hypothetical protein